MGLKSMGLKSMGLNSMELRGGLKSDTCDLPPSTGFKVIPPSGNCEAAGGVA